MGHVRRRHMSVQASTVRRKCAHPLHSVATDDDMLVKGIPFHRRREQGREYPDGDEDCDTDDPGRPEQPG